MKIGTAFAIGISSNEEYHKEINYEAIELSNSLVVHALRVSVCS